MMVAQRIQRSGGGQKVARNEFGPLMDQLVKRMLTVGSRLTPDHRPCAVIDRLAVSGNALAVALHVALLEISREARHILVIRQYRLSLCAEEIVIPDADQ